MSDVQTQTGSPAPAKTAPGWEKWHDWNERAMRPTTDHLSLALALTPGQRVLDLCCGTGLPALSLAARVSPGGAVLATDLSPEMVEATRRFAARAGIDNLEARVMNAQEIDYPDASFDAVSCAFGLMFCPDPGACVAEIRRVLKPGGRFALAVWSLPENNPFFTTVFQAVGRFMPPPPPPAANARSMFGLGQEAELSRVLHAGGFDDFSIESVAFEIEFESLEQHWQMFSDVAPPVKAAKSSLSPDELSRLRQALTETLAPYTQGSQVRLSATASCASGRK